MLNRYYDRQNDFISVSIDNDDSEKIMENNNVITMLNVDTFKKADIEKRKILSEKLKQDFDEQKCVSVYSDNDQLITEETIYEILGMEPVVSIKYADKLALKNAQYIIGSSIMKKDNGNIVIDTCYNITDDSTDALNLEKNVDLVADSCISALVERNTPPRSKTCDEFELQGVTDGNCVIQTATYDYYYGIEGSFHMTTYIYRASYGQTGSVWDVKGSNTTMMTNAKDSSGRKWYMEKLASRYSVDGFSAQKLIDHGPTTTVGTNSTGSSSGTSASVGLSLTGPSIQFGASSGVNWSFSLPAVDCVDYTQYKDPSGGYARWELTYSKAKDSEGKFTIINDAADNSYKSEPGARFTNTSGVFVVEVSHTMYVSRKKTASETTQPYVNIEHPTGVLQYYLHDRGCPNYYQ